MVNDNNDNMKGMNMTDVSVEKIRGMVTPQQVAGFIDVFVPPFKLEAWMDEVWDELDGEDVSRALDEHYDFFPAFTLELAIYMKEVEGTYPLEGWELEGAKTLAEVQERVTRSVTDGVEGALVEVIRTAIEYAYDQDPLSWPNTLGQFVA